jgi:5'-3' exonuclease
MDVHLIDGTYELFRHFFAVPSAADSNGQEIGAVRGVLNSVLSMIERGATHIGVATDHVVESFRNDLYPGYKTSEGVPPELLAVPRSRGSARNNGSGGVADGQL